MFSMNEGTTDRIIRVALGIVMLALGWLNLVSEPWATVLQWLGFVPLITGIVGWCPIYAVLGIRTNKERARIEA